MAGRPSQRSAHDHSCHDEPAENWEDEIRHHLRPGFVLLGVGSRMRSDDGAGSIVAERLARSGLKNAFDCGGVPENYLGRVEKLQPSDVLFVDAVDFGAPPGTAALFGGRTFRVQSLSTHSAGLSPIVDFLAQACDALCYVLAIQPQSVAEGEGLSEPVQRAVEAIVSSPVWLGLDGGLPSEV